MARSSIPSRVSWRRCQWALWYLHPLMKTWATIRRWERLHMYLSRPYASSPTSCIFSYQVRSCSLGPCFNSPVYRALRAVSVLGRTCLQANIQSCMVWRDPFTASLLRPFNLEQLLLEVGQQGVVQEVYLGFGLERPLHPREPIYEVGV